MAPPQQFDRKRVWNVCAALVVLGLVLPSVIQDALHRSFQSDVPPGVPTDFAHYYLSGRLARLKPPENLLYYLPVDHPARSVIDLRIDASTPYGRTSFTGDLPVTYPYIAPPFSAIMMEPFTFLPWKAAYLVWQLLCTAMLMVSVYLVLRLAQTNPPPMMTVAIVISLGFLCLPFKRVLTVGNTDVVLLLLWVLGVVWLRQGRAIPSAFCFALGTAVKVSPVFAVPFFAVRRQWRWLAWYGVWSVALLILSVWGVGWQNQVVWAASVSPVISRGINWFENRSLAGFVLALSAPHHLLTGLPAPVGWSLFNRALSAIFYAAFLYACWRKRKDSQGLIFEIILLPMVVLLVSPLTWRSHYVFALLPLVYLWFRSRELMVAVSKLDLILLTGSTVIIGAALPEYRVAWALGPPAQLLIMAAWIAAALAPLWVGMRMYESCIRERLQPAMAPVSAELVDH